MAYQIGIQRNLSKEKYLVVCLALVLQKIYDGGVRAEP